MDRNRGGFELLRINFPAAPAYIEALATAMSVLGAWDAQLRRGPSSCRHSIPVAAGPEAGTPPRRVPSHGRRLSRAWVQR